MITIVALVSKAQSTSPLDSISESFKSSLNQMLNKYLEIENSLMKGNTAEAGKAADELNKLTASIKKEGLTKAQLKFVNKEFGNITHNSEHIHDNSKDFDHQCEHFDNLSDSFYKLLKSFRFNSVIIYYNYTADGNGGNSAHWLTDKSTLEDPYFKGQTKNKDKQIEILK